jgi:hypothetical protein
MIGLGASAFIFVVGLITPERQGECFISKKQEGVLLTVGLTAVSTTLGGINRVTVPVCMDASSDSRMSGYRAV